MPLSKMAMKTNPWFKSGNCMDSRKKVNHMRRYEAPEMEIVEFEAEDILTTSGELIEDGDVD